MTNSADIAIWLAKEMKGMDTTSGKSFELSSILRPLLLLGGWTIPLVGFEGRQSTTSNRFYKSLQSVEAFPLGYFDYSRAISIFEENY